MHLPCMHLRPAFTTSQSDESIITGTRAMSGSADSMLRKVTIDERASMSPSSMLMSITSAPSATCLRAMAKASSKLRSLTSLRNLREPATLQRSPTLTKRTSGDTSRTSSPLSLIVAGRGAGLRGVLPSTSAGKSLMNCSVVPQHPPIMFTSPSSTNSATSAAMLSGVSSYSPRLLGSPAFGYALT